MDTYMHKTMVSVASLEKFEIIRSQEFMPSEARQKFLKKMIILGPKTAILGPQFCRILVLGPHFWWSGGAQAPGSPLDPPLRRLVLSEQVLLIRSNCSFVLDSTLNFARRKNFYGLLSCTLILRRKGI